MDETEKLVAEYLAHRGFSDVVYEPDGNIPPDFLVNGHIAIEARRLNQNHVADGKRQGLEEVAIPLWNGLTKIAMSMGPPTRGMSWFVFVRIRRPVEKWKTLEKKVRTAFTEFISAPSHVEKSVKIGVGVEVVFYPTNHRHDTVFVMAGRVDRQAGGWLLAELAKNLQICMDEKLKKIEAVRPKYSEWWLALEDRIGYGLGESEQQQLRELLSPIYGWDKVILIDPTTCVRSFEL